MGVRVYGRCALPQSPDGVVIEGGINAYHREVFRQALGGKEPVKGIAMVERQSGNLRHVVDAKREQGESVSFHLFGDQAFEGLLEAEPPKADLNGHFPQAGRADAIWRLFRPR